MFAKETYIQRRALLKKNIGSGVLLFLGNDEQDCIMRTILSVIVRILPSCIISVVVCRFVGDYRY